MRTRSSSSSNLPCESSPNPTSSNPKRHNRRRSNQPFILEESPVDTMADQRTMAELLHAPTEGYAEAIVFLLILAEHFKLKHSLINMMTSDQFFGLEKNNPHDHIHHLRACPHHGFTELHQLDTFYNALNPVDQDSLNYAAGGKLLETRTQDVLTIIEQIQAKRTHAVNQQTSVVTAAMTAILKQFQATPPPPSVKAVEEIYVTCGGAHPYYQCLAVDGNTFLEFWDNIQGYVSAAAANYNLDSSYQALMQQSQVVPLSELEKIKKINEINIKAMQTQINNVKNELINETKTSIQASMSNQTNERKNMMASFFQMNTASTSGSGPLPSNTIANPKGELKAITTRSGLILDGPLISMPPPLINAKEDEHVEETLTKLELSFLALRSHFLLSKKLKLILKETICELKCKALADLGSSINLMPLSVWKKLGRPFLRTARALIDVHEEEMILRNGDERLTLNMRHDTSIYSNQPQKESINMINIYHDSCEDYLEDLFATNHRSGNPTFSFHSDLTLPEVKDDIFDPEEDIVLIEKFLNLDSTKNLSPPHNINPLSGSTTSSFSFDHLLEEFADELALITFPPGNNDLPFDIESNLIEIDYLLNHDPRNNTASSRSLMTNWILTYQYIYIYIYICMFIDEHAIDYSSPPLYDDFDDDLDELKSDNDDAYNDPFNSKEEKIKESKLLIDELDLPRSSDFLLSPKYDSFFFEDFFEVDALPSTNTEDKVFNPGKDYAQNVKNQSKTGQYRTRKSTTKAESTGIFLSNQPMKLKSQKNQSSSLKSSFVMPNASAEIPNAPEPSYNQNYDGNYYPHESPSFPCYDNCGESHETFECQPIDQNVDFSGSDQIQTPQYPEIHPPSNEISDEVFYAKCDLMKSIQSFLKEFNYIPFEEKPHILFQEVKNVVEQPSEGGNCIIESLQNFRVIHNMRYENPNATLKMESDEIIKSRVEELVPILSENEVTSGDKKECDVPDIEYVEASLFDPEIVRIEEENVVHQEEEEIDLEDVFQIQDIILREKLLSINRLIANIESLNDNPTPDHVLNSSVSFPISEESDNSLSDNFSPEFETFYDHTKETRSGSTTTHADDSFPESRFISFSDNSIPPGTENFADDSEGDIRFLEALLIDDFIPSPVNESSESEDNPSNPRPPPEPPDAEFDFKPDSEEEIPVVMNDRDEYNDDYYSFMFVIYSKMFLSFLSTESDDTIFDPDISV
nr:hypothetical protein [Tanacetum cinerariifolium]